MTGISETVRALWARTRVSAWPEDYVLVSLPHSALMMAVDLVNRYGLGSFAVIVVERDEVSLTVTHTAWATVDDPSVARAIDGPYRAITLDLEIDLGVSGYLLPAADRLANAGIAIVPQCAYSKDHLLIRAARADDARVILEALVAECGIAGF